MDVMLEIAERNGDLRSFRLTRFVDRPPRSITLDGRKYFWLYVSPPEELLSSLLSMRDESLGEKDGSLIGLTSFVRRKDGYHAHIPLLDFETPVSDEALVLIREKFKTIMREARSGKATPGYLLVSGECYHYIGLELLSQEEWLEFMGLALLFEDDADPNRFSPVDRRWVGYSLRRGLSTLRIFSGEKLLQPRPEPYVVAFIE
jgi:hypothetical protein